MPNDIVEAIERVCVLSEEPNSEPVAVSGMYRPANNHAAGINARNAIEVLATGRVERWKLEDAWHTLACKLVNVGRPYLALVYASENPPAAVGTAINFSWRLYDSDPELRPTEAFAEILDRYGMPVKCGDRSGLFLALETIEGGDLTLGGADSDMDPSESFTVSGMMQRLPNGYSQLTWAFGVRDSRYLEDVRRSRG